MQKSTVQERPWSEHEKLFLLAEILKLSPVPASALLRLIRDFEVDPRWEDIPLPEGRSLNSSKLAFDEVHQQTGYRTGHTPNSFSQHPSQSQIPGADTARKRPLSRAEVLTPGFPAIQPKPPGLSPAPFAPVLAGRRGPARDSPGDPTNKLVKKKRGRPSNAQIEQEKALAAAEGREWQPRPSRTSRKKKIKPSGELDLTRSEDGHTHQYSPQTPEVRLSDGDEGNSTGEKRRRKSREDTATAVVRATPYDPVRQSPSHAPYGATETPPGVLEDEAIPPPQVPFAMTSAIHPASEPPTSRFAYHADISPNADPLNSPPKSAE